jgi:serine/threonine-protein kinase
MVNFSSPSPEGKAEASQREESAFDALIVAALRQAPVDPSLASDFTDPDKVLTAEDQQALDALGPSLVDRILAVAGGRQPVAHIPAPENSFDGFGEVHESGSETSAPRSQIRSAEFPCTAASAMSFAGAPPHPGWVRGYEVLEVLGRGGMGIVYKARQRSVNRLVALKMVLAGAHAGREALARFRIEGQAIARLSHPNAVAIYEFGEHDGLPYYSMELMEGGSLAARLAQGPLPPREAAALVRKLAGAVAYVHQAKVLHRDLNPNNILFGADGSVKIADFGLAKLLDEDDGQTHIGMVLGTPSYMAPEQANGESKAVGPATDVYALGAILYQTLAGRPPFQGTNRAETIRHVVEDYPARLSAVRPDVPRDLEAICLKCLAKWPASRYATAQALADDLDRWLLGKPTAARPLRWFARYCLWMRRRPRMVCVALVLVLSQVAVLAGLSFSTKAELGRMQNQIGAGESVTLIGPTGTPRWFRLRAGEDTTHVSSHKDGTFAVHSWGSCLIELLPDPGWNSYRFSGQIRHENSDHSGGVGLFVGHRSFAGPYAEIQMFTLVSFNDVHGEAGSPAPNSDLTSPGVAPFTDRNVVSLDSRVWYSARNRLTRDYQAARVAGARFKASGAGGGPWHELDVIVTPKSIQALWDGKPVACLPAAAEGALGPLLNQGLDDAWLQTIPTDFRPRGSLGLYVQRGSAHFRSVRVSPTEQTPSE